MAIHRSLKKYQVNASGSLFHGGLWFFAGHQCWAMWLQAQHFWFFVHPFAVGLAPATWVFRHFPLLQWENLLISCGLGLSFLLTRLHWTGKPASGLLFAATNAVLLLNQISFHLTGDHLRASFAEEGSWRWSALIDSVRPALGRLWWANLALFFLLHVVVFVGVRSVLKDLKGANDPDDPRDSDNSDESAESALLAATLKKGLIGAWCGLALLAIGVNYRVLPPAPTYKLERHPLLVLLQEYRAPRHLINTAFRAVPDFQKPRIAYRESLEERNALRWRCEKIRQATPAPHIFFLVLESVGARQLLKQGRPDPSLTPNIARLASSGIMFDAVYTSFPATARSHVPIVSGGDPFQDAIILNRQAPPPAKPHLLSEFRKRGYRTALFASSDLNFGNLDQLLQGLGFDHFFHFGVADPEFQTKYQLNSWGGSEDGVLYKLETWLQDQKNVSAPLFIEFLPNATHHPYSAPRHFVSPFKGASDEEKYRHSLHYVDDWLGKIVALTEKFDLYKNSLFVVCGDHGEAFGKLHPGSFLHQSYLYEENVRSFLLLSAPCLAGTPLVSSRFGNLGDLLATLLPLTGVPTSDPAPAPAPAPALKGRNLAAFVDEPRIAFFYKLAFPAKWGCRDDSWKFIGNMYAPQDPELFDLATDPDERHNLAALHPELVEDYDARCRSWFSRSSPALLRLLDPLPRVGHVAWPAEAADWATDTIITGTLDAGGSFRATDRFHPYQRVYVAIKPGSDTYQPLHVDWRSPIGQHFANDTRIGSSSPQILTSFSGGLPMVDGPWEVMFREGHTIVFNRPFICDFSVEPDHPDTFTE
jgi:arylsulfatase A-like enzyme